MGFTEDDLKKMGLVKQADGSYGKPRKEHPSKQPKATLSSSVTPEQLSFISAIPIASTGKVLVDSSITMRKITLTLFGIPMPKQSVRAGIAKDKKTILFYQDKEKTDRVKDYQKQIREQLPKDFVMFTKMVHVRKLHFVYPPLKGFQKIKGRMEALRNGQIFYKPTKPDLPDNLQKILFDSMSKIVFEDDGLVVTENDIAKYYGTGGMIIIELEGW